MNDVPSSATVVARLSADEKKARALADAIAERFGPDEIAASAFETADGWAVEIVFPRAPDESRLRAFVASEAGEAVARTLVFERVAAKDWVAASLAGLAPVAAGRFVVHGAHDRARVPPNRIGIEIEAALAFGTGHHGTTRGCLLAFDRLLKARRPRRVLDIGTGTGILAIAAARTLPARVTATDIDKAAVKVARENARANRSAARIGTVATAGVQRLALWSHAPYDLIFANILIGPLLRMAAGASRLLAPGGRIILSGLLPEHANATIAAYRLQGLVLERRIMLDRWATLVMARPS